MFALVLISYEFLVMYINDNMLCVLTCKIYKKYTLFENSGY